MTTERFKVDKYYFEIWDNDELLSFDQTVDLLNQLNDENEQLKQAYSKLKHRHSLLHDECLDLECDKDEYYKDVLSLEEENEELKQVLGSILIEVRRDISATNHSGEVKAFVNPNSFDLISNVLKKYGALK